MASTRRRRRPRKTESATGLLAVGLGGNVGDAEARLRWAIDRLEEAYGPLRTAPLYRTAPISPIQQADFLNTVTLATLPAVDPLQVLARTQGLERLAGCRAGERDGPRPLDIDLLLFGDLVRPAPAATHDRRARGPRSELILPHPRMRHRRFVLAPLADLMPGLRLPPDGAVVRDLLAALGSDQAVERIGWT